MSEFERPCPERGLSRVQLERFFRHHQWLNTGGRYGERFIFVEKGSSPGKSFVSQDLDGVDLSRSVIGGISFKGSSLRGARFVGVELRHITFYKCDLEGADFSGATLVDVSFIESNPRQACFDGADTAGVDWDAKPPAPISRLLTNSPKL